MTVDILAYITSMMLAFYLIYTNPNLNQFEIIGYILFILILTIFAVFTIIPPKSQIFLDETTNTYGIVEV